MNPVNRQYFERANLFRHMGLIGTHCSQNGLQKGAFSGSRNRNSFSIRSFQIIVDTNDLELKIIHARLMAAPSLARQSGSLRGTCIVQIPCLSQGQLKPFGCLNLPAYCNNGL